MGLTISLENERGSALRTVGDPHNILHRVLPPPEDKSFRCLNRVDWYGDTTFNRPQMADVRPELQKLIASVTTLDARALLEQIAELAALCDAEPHRYLKFYGD